MHRTQHMLAPAITSYDGNDRQRNPFVKISSPLRAAVIVYFIGWRILPTTTMLVDPNTENIGAVAAIVLAIITAELLILLPFMRSKFAGTPVGWLHPLILPTVVTTIFGLMRNPGSLLVPLTSWIEPRAISDHVLLAGWSDSLILEAQLKLSMLNLLALLATYAGFTVRWKLPANRPRIVISGKRLAWLFGFSFILVLVFLQLQGGVLAHMASLASGRYRMRELSGHFLVVNAFLPYILLLWYAYRPAALRNPVFLLAFASVALLQFVVTGSRSGLFTPLAMLLAVWIFHHHKLPAVRAFALGASAVLLLGVLGDIRQSGRDGKVDFSSLSGLDVTAALDDTYDELDSRSLDTGMAVAALVPKQVDYLYGSTYVAALAFWIPRVLWRDKPRGAGAYASAVLYGGLSVEHMSGYRGGGYPVGGVPEAYWNFGISGVVLVFFFYGGLLRFGASWLISQPANPFAVTFLILLLFGLNTPNTISLVPFAQRIVLLYLTYKLVARSTK